MKVLEHAKHGATFLLNSPYGPDEVWDHLPVELQHQLVDKEIDLWVIDAMAVAAEIGMGNRINTIMQPCFFHLSGVLPADEAIERIKGFVEEDLLEARRGRRPAQLRGHRPLDRAAGPGRAAAGRREPRRSRRSSPTRPPTSSGTSPRG